MSTTTSRKKLFTTTTGKRTPQVKAKIVRMRDKDGLAWRAIAAELEMAPRSVRRIYDEKLGEGAHFNSRIGKGGRVRNSETANA